VSKGVISVVPIISMWWFFISVFNINIPPTLGFFSEVFIISSIMSFDGLVFFPVGLILFFSGVYGIYFYCIGIHGSLRFEGVISPGLFFDYYVVLFSCFVGLASSILVGYVFFWFKQVYKIECAVCGIVRYCNHCFSCMGFFSFSFSFSRLFSLFFCGCAAALVLNYVFTRGTTVL